MTGLVAPLAAITVLAGSSSALGQCPADLDDDGEVAALDLAALLAAWGSDAGGKSDADLTGDGIVDALDLAALLAAWGPCGPIVPSWATLVEAQPDPAVVYDASARRRMIDTGYAWRVRDTATQIEMVLIPPGTFQMGCSASFLYPCFSAENPVHAVTLTNAFYMGRHEVTQAQWTARMGANPSFFTEANGYGPSDDRPVEQVSWNAIAGPKGFLAGTGLRLPTEAEWEYACRAGTTTAFHGWLAQPSGTNNDAAVASIAWTWTGDCTGGAQCRTHPVGQKAGNGFGLHDMSGNVAEWVNDWYSGTYYASSPSMDPPGPSSGSDHVLRGGSWFGISRYLRASDRVSESPGAVGIRFGFRVARNP